MFGRMGHGFTALSHDIDSAKLCFVQAKFCKFLSCARLSFVFFDRGGI